MIISKKDITALNCDECIYFPDPHHKEWQSKYKGFKCLKNKEMEFKMPGSYECDNWGFYREGCFDFRLNKIETKKRIVFKRENKLRLESEK